MFSFIGDVSAAIASSYNYDGGGAAAAAFWAIYAIFIFVFAVGGYVLSALFLMKIFEKAGVEGKWRAWVPYYNLMIFFKLGDVSPWLVFASLLTWIPVLGWLVGIGFAIVAVLAAWRVGLKLQKDSVWVILYVFLSLVWLGINAFDKSRWNPNIAPASWANNGFLADRTVWQGIPVQPRPAAGPGYGSPQGYGAPQGYAPPAPQGYAPPAQPGYAPPAQPGYAPPAAPSAPSAPGVPPAAPSAPPAAPQVPPAPPAAPPAAPPVPPTNPTQPPA
ncbi:large exoprotein [Microbacterium phyllosphaerae]|uniref:large exoprotein n=1 Tax=Microbacterium phyllosphaerae TaxID=124798 RepID=UPI003D6509C5